MRYPIIIAAALVAIACNPKTEPTAKIETPIGTAPIPTNPAPIPITAAVVPAKRRLFLDVHELGEGKVTVKAVADAHKKDLETEGKYGVDYRAYWVDEKAGKIYCLVEAPSAEAASATHKEAHGLVANKVMEVTPDNTSWAPTPGKKLYMDVHRMGAGKVTAEAVAAAHTKDLAAQAKHGVKYLNYWVDVTSGTIMCLSEAPSAEAAVAVHKEAHGLIPESIDAVAEGR